MASDAPRPRDALLRHWRDAREVFARRGRQTAAQLWAAADEALARSAQHQPLDDRALLAAVADVRAALTRAVRLGDEQAARERVRAAAAIAALAARFLGQTPRRDQLFAALAMQEGHAVDMPAGSGKTLAVACCAILHAWSARRCHVATADERFAERDVRAMGPLYAMADCSVGWLDAEVAPARATEIYACDVIYAAPRRLLSDFVRDRSLLGNAAGLLRRQLWAMRQPAEGQKPVMGDLAAVVIDDIDRVLLDEALAPLVVSASGDGGILDDATRRAAALVERLKPERDYRIDFLPAADIVFTEAGHALFEELARELPPFWRHPRRAEDVLTNAIIARDVLQEGRHYALREGRIHAAGEGLQVLLGTRAWHLGVLQAVETRAGLTPSAPPRTLARASFQEFFPLYRYLSGAGALLDDVAPELRRLYRIQTLQSAPGGRRALRHHVSATHAGKVSALVERVLHLHRQDLPAIVLASGIAEMEAVAAPLVEAGVPVQAVLGMQPEQDMLRLQQAGQPGAVTMMTLGALRGTPIAVPGRTAAAGGLHILSCGHQDLARLDELIAARAEAAELFVSPEDEIFSRALPFWARPLRRLASCAPIRAGLLALLARAAQRHTMAQLARHRVLLLKREEQLDLQLAFSRKT